jgi:acetoin utilization protein AcuB
MKHMPQIIAFMTPFPFSIDVDAPLAEARAFMQKQHIRHLPVTRAGALCGIVTDRDIHLMLGPDFAYPPERELKVSDVSVAEPYVVAASAPADEVVTTMADRHIGSALVTRDGKLVGLVTTTDVCRALARVLQERFPPPRLPGEAA